MMRWNVIHKIKSLHDDGKGLSIRAISRELGISRNSVRKYLRQDETTTARKLDNPVRSKQLDTYRGYLISLLASFPGYRKYKPPFCSSSEVSYLKFPHSFTAQAPILTAGPA